MGNDLKSGDISHGLVRQFCRFVSVASCHQAAAGCRRYFRFYAFDPESVATIRTEPCDGFKTSLLEILNKIQICHRAGRTCLQWFFDR